LSSVVVVPLSVAPLSLVALSVVPSSVTSGGSGSAPLPEQPVFTASAIVISLTGSPWCCRELRKFREIVL